MTWFFLSAFSDMLQKGSHAVPDMQEICDEDNKFNEMYVKDKKKTEKLYSRFIQTNTYKNFLSSGSLSKLFN
jgi:hypothetical protein